MKLIIVALLTVFAFSAQADNEEIIKDIFGNIIGGIVNGNNGGNGHGHGGGGHGHGGGGWGNGGNGGGWGNGNGNGGNWGNNGGNVVCSAADKGWEEHGSHASCRECFRKHGSCVETCSRATIECSVEGTDRRGRRTTYYGSGSDYRQAQWNADDACYRARARDCRPLRCDQRSEVVSRRDCRR